MSAGALALVLEGVALCRGFSLGAVTRIRSGLKHDVFERFAAGEAVEIGGHHAPAPVGGRAAGARTVRRDQHVGQFMERASRRPPLPLGLGGVLPPHIERGAAEAVILERGVERILVDDRRPRDVDQQRAGLH